MIFKGINVGNECNIHVSGFCLGSSGKLMDQCLIKDHMLSHYRKLYSAKGKSIINVYKYIKFIDFCIFTIKPLTIGKIIGY